MTSLSKSAQPKHVLTDEQMFDLADKCFEFCKQASGVTLYSYQEHFALRMIQSILFEDGEEITALFSRQSGKTETVSCVITGLCVILPSLARMPDLKVDDRIAKFKDGFWVGIFAPSYELAGIMHARMSSRMQSETMQAVLSDPDLGIDLQGGRKVLRLPNGSYVDANSAGPQANIEGKTYHAIICEECQDISNYKIKKCLAHDTEIYTLKGKVKISDLNGEPLPQVTKDGRLNVVYDYEHHDNGLQDVWRVTTAGGYYLDATENHRWLTRTQGHDGLSVKATRDLSLNDMLPIPDQQAVEQLFAEEFDLQSMNCDIAHKGHGKGAGVPPNMRFARITSIKYLGKKQTYCLTLENETFIANGMLSLNSIHPMLASTNGTIIKIGTPNAQKGDFFDACERNRIRTATGGGLPTHFQYDYEYPARNNPRYRRYIEKEIERLGYDSDEFRMSYRLHWLLERGHFIPPEIFDSCGISERDTLRVKKKGSYIHFKRPSSPYGNDTTSENMVASLDIGRANDSTVITVAKVWWDNPQMFAGEDRYYAHVVNWLEIEGDDHETQYPQILDFLEKYNIGILIVDATGRGDPIYDRLNADLWDKGIRVVPFIFSQRSKHEGYTVMYQELKECRLTYPAGDHARSQRKWQRFVKQMYDLQKEWKGKYMDVKAPTSGKKGGSNSDGHDDYPDSLMMLCYAINRKLISAEVGDNPFIGSRAVANARRLAGSRIGEGAQRGRRKFDGW